LYYGSIGGHLKVALVAPAATVRLDGTIAAFALLVESWTVTPVLGAARLLNGIPSFQINVVIAEKGDRPELLLAMLVATIEVSLVWYRGCSDPQG